MKVLIVEDEQLLARQLISMLMKLAPDVEVAATTNSIAATAQWLSNNAAPDLILMDIELADGQSFEVFNLVTINSPVIFTTAYDEYALKAFKVNSIDYLLKPVKEEELENALHKWKMLLNQPRANQAAQDLLALVSELKKAGNGKGYRERFLIKQGQKMVSVSMEDAALFFARNTLNYLVTTSKKKYIIEYSLDDVEQFVDPRKFFRVNRQFILSHHIIKAVLPWINGKLKLEIGLPTEDEIIVSRDKAPLFKEWMGA